MNQILQKIFIECNRAINTGELITKVSSTDKEFSFQNWFQKKLQALNLNFDTPSRNAYPDFRLVDYPLGFEVKGLAFPGREANYDCNSQVPSGIHNGRTIYYVFGRYPAQTKEKSYPVYDLVICHGDFLNADHDYIHKNKNLKGFGSYGDIMIRDRKMYVAPTPFALVNGAERQVTLIVPSEWKSNNAMVCSVGSFVRKESDTLIRGYSFDMASNTITATYIKNPNAGKIHSFQAYRTSCSQGNTVSLR